MPREPRLTSKRFWDRVEQLDRLADLHGSRFDGDTPERRLRRMAEAVVLPARFNVHYLPHYFRDAGSPFHDLLYLVFEWAKFAAVRAPRGHGKTTVGSFAYGLHQVACGETLRKLELGVLQDEDPELFAEIEKVMAEEVGRRLAAGVPTTQTLGLPAHWDPTADEDLNAWLEEVHELLATTRRIPLFWDPYIQVCAVDSTTATEFSAAIRAELERNPLLRSDWGDLTPCHHKDWDRKVRRSASDGDFASNGIRVRAFGMQQSLRGGKHGEWRPTLFLGDDLDSEETTRTPTQRDANIKKVTTAASYGLDERKKRIYLVGTPVESDCVVCRLTEHDQYHRRFTDDGELVGRWVGVRLRARDEKGVILYPAKWSAEALDAEEAEDEEAYGSELDDRPPSDGASPFDALNHYSRADFADVKLAKVMVFDPALGRTKKADLQAVVVVRGPTVDGEFLVEFCDGFRIPDLIELCHTVNQIRDQQQPDEAAVETIGFQALMEVMLAAEGQRMGLLDNWYKIESHDEGKDLRIRGLARLSNNGKLRWPDDGSCKKGERQARRYPKGKVDILDGIEMAIRRLRMHGRGASTWKIRREPRRAQFGAGAW